MAKINGTYVSLHEACDNYPYYKGELEFKETWCLAEYFEKEGACDTSATYQLKDIPSENTDTDVPKIQKAEALFTGKVPDKILLFTESNSAHHLTYFYVKETAKHLSPNDKLLVINFDQHEDTGSEDGLFFCGSWGGNRICNAAGCDYLVVGPKYTRKTSFGSLAEYLEYKKQNAGNPVPAYVAKLYTCEGSIIDCSNDSIKSLCERYDKIYVTVDMDVLTCGSDVKRTNWPSGNMAFEQLKKHLAEIPADKLISTDITGFPPVDSSKLENSHSLFDSYIEDICETSEILCGLMGIPPYID